MKRKLTAVTLITVLICVGLGNIVACTPTPTTEYGLIISSTAGGSVTTPGEGTFTYDEGTVVDLVATPDAGYRFVNWTGDVGTIADVNAATTTITMNGDYSITANFVVEPEPVDIIILIRSDLPPYPAAGDYVADQLELLGFQVTRLLKTGAEASPIWLGTHPSEGAFSVYTGGWSSPTIPRDEADIFDQMYTHRVMTGFALWEVLEEQLQDFPLLDSASRQLRYRQFAGMPARGALFAAVLWEAMKFSNCIWVADTYGFNPFRSEVRVAVNLAGGIGDPNWVHTAHFHDALVPILPTGTTHMRIELPNLFINPWNPVAGWSWTYDMFVTGRALGDSACMADPTTGLYWPQRLESSEVWVDSTLPVGQTIDWGGNLMMHPVAAADPNLVTPGTAWADWDAVAQAWITVATKFPVAADRVALSKTTVVYPGDLWTIPLHDGSTLSPADFLLGMIYTFDRGKADSPVFEPTYEAALEAWLDTFKGFQVDSWDPLTITTWSDMWYLDVELFPDARHWWPQYGTYDWTGFWHMIAVGWAAEADDTGATGGVAGAWSKTKAAAQEPEVPWLDYTKGTDSFDVLDAELAWAKAAAFIPYQTAIQAVYTAEGLNLPAEITARWLALENFRATSHHFWVGNGPFWIEDAETDLSPPSSVVLTRFVGYPDPADKWLFFLDPDPVFVPAHTGAWVDKVFLSVQPSPAVAVAKLKAGVIDIYAHPIIDAELFDDIVAHPEINYGASYGSCADLRFNTYRDPATKEPFFADARLNPFAIPEIREAMNWLIDREYIVGALLGGMGRPKWTALGTGFADHHRYPGIVGAIEASYAYNFTQAKDIIDAEMLAIPGVSLIDGIWHYLAP